MAFGVSARTGEVSDTVLGVTGAPGSPRPGAAAARTAGRRRRWPRLGTLVAVLAVSLLLAGVVRVTLASVATVTSASMSPALEPGDRALVWKPGPVQRGDVVVVRDQGWARFAGGGAAPPGDTAADLVKRVVALPGERVRCCDSAGFLTVDGARLQEPYLPPGTAASDVAFDVQVPPESVWLLGDARQASRDSRAGLGLPGGGAVPMRDVVGRVVAVMWPPERAAAVPRTAPTEESP